MRIVNTAKYVKCHQQSTCECKENLFFEDCYFGSQYQIVFLGDPELPFWSWVKSSKIWHSFHTYTLKIGEIQSSPSMLMEPLPIRGVLFSILT